MQGLTIQNNSQRSVLGLFASELQHLSQELLRHRRRGAFFADHEERLPVAIRQADEYSQRSHCQELRHGDGVRVLHPRLQLFGAAALQRKEQS